MGTARRVHLRIHGSVQGVSFRYYARQRAEALGLAGWIRNCPDGSVEASIQGEREAVDEFVRWARRGPSMARVDRVDEDEETPDAAMRAFRIVG